MPSPKEIEASICLRFITLKGATYSHDDKIISKSFNRSSIAKADMPSIVSCHVDADTVLCRLVTKKHIWSF